MKKNLFTFAATAAITMCAGIASAQTTEISMDVPVEFRTSNASLKEGKYRIVAARTVSGSAVFSFRNQSTGQAAAAVPVAFHSMPKEAPAAARFACVESACHLVSINNGATEYLFRAPRMTPEQKQRLYTVVVTADAPTALD